MTEAWTPAIAALWSVWAGFWWWSARALKRVRRRESLPSRLLHLGPLAVAAALLALPRVPGWLGTRIIDGHAAAAAAGTLLTAAGLTLSVWARRLLGGNWSASVTIKEAHEIVQAGPYRWIRHPIYAGLLLALAGSALARDEWRGPVALTVAFMALWRKLRLEERWLSEEFGARYAAYRRHTRALVPFLL
ncbi:MAG: isoprenylcysteine carboxylmethyltransferase family protein [Proteobacteria bacterium]|nr:isoprenylcysteine carboxylmethyltransferase family protein [Pseudomonadota bacterium]